MEEKERMVFRLNFDSHDRAKFVMKGRGLIEQDETVKSSCEQQDSL